MAVVDETCASNIVFHDPSGRDIRGLQGFKQSLSELFEAFPDIHITIDDLIIEADKAVIRYTMAGTHKGPRMGIPATNKKVTLSVIVIDRVAGCKFVECWQMFDTLGFMQQLGVIPTPKK